MMLKNNDKTVLGDTEWNKALVNKSTKNIIRFDVRSMVTTMRALVLILASTISAVVVAADSSIIDEIVVTSQKRAQNLQDVSLAVTALSGDALEKLGFEEGLDITQQVPNMGFFAIFGEASSPSISLRGISLVNFSDSWESPVSLYVDEVYRGNPAGSAIQLMDLERVEVLRGPQGTIYGRNTTGGLVHYVSKNPTEEFEASLSARVGSYSESVVEGVVSGPISERVLGRLAVKFNNNEGWQTNAVDGRKLNDTDNVAYRGKLAFDLGDTSELIVDIHGSQADQQTVGFAHLGYLDPIDGTLCSLSRINNGDCISSIPGAQTGRDEAGGWGPENVASSSSSGLATEIDTFGLSAKLTKDFDNITFTSITAVEELEKFLQDDGDGTAVVWFDEQYRVDAKQLTQELQLNGGDELTQWVTGLYYYKDARDLLTQAPAAAEAVLFGGFFHQEIVNLDSESWALFGQLEYSFTESLTLLVGGRYTQEDREFQQDAGPSFYTASATALDVQNNLSDSAFTGRLGLDWRPNENTLIYGSLSTGFKSGGFSGSYNANLAATEPVDAEDITNFELGLKTTLADGRLRLNMAAFTYEVEDFQTQVFLTVATGSIITNAGDLTGTGLEAELTAQVSDNFEVIAGLGFLRTEFDSDRSFTVAGTGYTLDGNEMPSAPGLTYNLVGRYYVGLGEAGELAFQADYSWQDDHYLQVENDPFSKHSGYGIANAKVSWRSDLGKLSAELFVENLADEEYFTYQNTLGGDWGYAVWGKPRTGGVRVVWKL